MTNSKTLVTCYKKVFSATKIVIQHNNPNLCLNKYIYCDTMKHNTVINNFNNLIEILTRPQFAHIYLPKKKYEKTKLFKNKS